MLKEKQNICQMRLIYSFEEQLNHKHPLYRLAEEIQWNKFEEALKGKYSDKMERPAKPIRLMVGLIILNHISNLSDESVVEQYEENSYYHICNEIYGRGDFQFFKFDLAKGTLRKISSKMDLLDSAHL